ncbi:RICIN domain-containing protein, partial [Streptomyces sp. NPDC048664]|uniref:RICIN domain-containing protein n=1 Tax=Streptomyces sp. NPDC048664 TaxID=3154505 RepID=UPI003423900A
RGRPRLAVDNLGNTRLTASVGGNDNGDHLSYDIHPSNIQIEPGRAAFLKTTLKPRKIIWFGPKEQRPYTLTVQRSGTTPLPVEGTYIQRGFLPRWLATFLGMLLALAITFVMIWISYKPQVKSLATEKLQDAGVSTLAPSPSATPALAPAPSPAAPTSEAPKSGSGNGDGGGGGGGGPAPSKKAGPPPVVPASNVLLRNTTTKKCVDIPGYDQGKINGGVGQFTCDQTTADNQLWNLEVRYPKLGPGGTPLFQIRNVKDQLCLDLPYFGEQPIRTPLSEFTCNGTTADNQLWWLDKQPSGAYWIRNYASDNKCLDVAGYADDGSDAKNGNRLTLFDCSNVDDQEWEIIHPSEG